ncbi:MAG: YciI family protein [Pseudomonadota bacterium]
MQYMALIYEAPDSVSGDADAVRSAYGALIQEMVAAGVFISGDELDGAETATSVQVRGGKTKVTDGPFAETKEQLGGYLLLDCASLDDAIGWAARFPNATNGTIEIRPVMVRG